MANNIFRITELDFDTIKTNLKNFLRSQSQFQDYDFDGAGLNILIDLLAYNTHYNAYYLNMVASESFLDSSVIRDAVVSHAKELNYTTTSRRAAVANVNVVVTPPANDSTGTLTLPIYTEFQSESIDGVNYPFVTIEAYSSTKNIVSNTFTFSGIELYQGEPLSFSFGVTPGNISTPFTIPNQNVDTSTLVVSVQNSVLDTTITPFNLADDLTTISANSKVYFLQESGGQKYSIYFGDGFLGSALSNGNIVITKFIVTDGQDSNKANSFTSLGSVGGFANVIVSVNSAAAGGADIESIDSIKLRAPIAYTQQNRAVTENDYTNLLTSDYPNVDQISVWGGDKNVPVIYGKVFISMKPKDGFTISNLEKQRIVNDILATRSVVPIAPVIIDPDYVYLLIKASVYFNPKLTTLTSSDIKNLSANTISTFIAQNVGKFNTPFKVSNLQTAIDQADASIQNSDLTVYLQKQFTPTLGASRNYTLNFNAPIQRGASAANKLTSYPGFSVLDATGLSRTAFIEEIPLSFTGVQSLAIQNPGQDYTSATLSFVGDGTGASGHVEIVNGRLSKAIVDETGSEYSIAQVVITGDGTSGSISAILSQQMGSLRLYYFDTNGQKIVIGNIGTIDYLNGIVTLQNFAPTAVNSNPYYLSGVININVTTTNQTISPSRNSLVVLDTSNPLATQINVLNA